MTDERQELEATPIESAVTTESETVAEKPVEIEEVVTAPEAEVEEVVAPSVTEEPAAEEAKAPEAAETPKTEDTEFSRAMAAGMGDDYSRTFRELSQGDLVDGVVVHIDKDGVLVDVGTKSEGLIRMGELTRQPVQSPEDVVSVGERIKVYVMESENQDGNLLLSKKRADFEKAWERVIQAQEEGKTITAMVTDRVKGGLVVDLGIRGFVPASHVGSGKIKNLDKYVGQSIPLKVIEVDRERRKVVLSHRLATESEREIKRAETVSTLAEGQVREGVVRRITDYGAFVDLGGVDGLLHISEMSWTRINHPSEVVKVGQKIQVMVLKLNLDAGRVSLGLRQILPDPWGDVESKYSVGQLVRGSVSRLVPFGAFVHLEGGIEGILPNVELARKRVNRPEDVVSVGEGVEAKIIDIRPEERRITLSIRQIHEEKEQREYESYRSTTTRDETRTTLGDLIGDKLQEFRTPVVEEKEAVEEAPAPRPKKRKRVEVPEDTEDLTDVTIDDMIVEAVEPEVAEEAPAVEVEAEAEAEAVEPAEEPEA